MARAAADELGVSLDSVTGTGPSGRITRKDIERLLQKAARHRCGAGVTFPNGTIARCTTPYGIPVSFVPDQLTPNAVGKAGCHQQKVALADLIHDAQDQLDASRTYRMPHLLLNFDLDCNALVAFRLRMPVLKSPLMI